MSTKTCPRCDEEKDTSEFNKDMKRKDGLQWICRECRKFYLKSRAEGDVGLKNSPEVIDRNLIFLNSLMNAMVRSHGRSA